MRKILTFISVILILIVLNGCKSIKKSDILFYEYFDTNIELTVWDTKKYDINDKLWQGAEEIIKRLHYTFKRTEPVDEEKASELYNLNKKAGTDKPIKVSDELFYLIKKSIDIAKETEGRFDPSIGALVDLWNIKSTDKDRGKDKEKDERRTRPKDEDIANSLSLVDYNLIKIDEENKTIVIPKEGMVIDLGGIAKGYAADKLVEYFNEKDIKHALLNVGGNIYALGDRYEEKDGTTNWKIGIRKPFNNSNLGILSVKNKTVVTSGVYERYFIDRVEEKRYHHILDTTTGFPVENKLLSVSIITENSTLADALSTSVFAMGLEDGMDFIENYESVEAVFSYYDENKDMAIAKSSGVDSLYHFE